MAENLYRMYGAPPIFPGESMSSWLQRLSQQQGISIQRLFTMVRSTVPNDVDAVEPSMALQTLIAQCGSGYAGFGIVSALGRSVQKVEPLQGQMHMNYEKKPISAFCPACLKADPTPYYRIEWRFLFWKYCPEHGLPLATACCECRQAIVLDKCILLSRTPPPSLAYCKYCLARLDCKNQPAVGDNRNIKEIIAVQRNMMAGILNGYCMIAPYEQKFTLHVMARLHQFGLLQPAIRSDFNMLVDPEQLFVLSKFLKKLQVKISSKELLPERASRRRRTG